VEGVRVVEEEVVGKEGEGGADEGEAWGWEEEGWVVGGAEMVKAAGT
jgi:hypothetical protein